MSQLSTKKQVWSTLVSTKSIENFKTWLTIAVNIFTIDIKQNSYIFCLPEHHILTSSDRSKGSGMGKGEDIPSAGTRELEAPPGQARSQTSERGVRE